MNSLSALGIAVVLSLIVSTLLVVPLAQPLRAMLRRICPGPETENFWGRFTMLMLYLSPLLVVLVFGVPDASDLDRLDFGQLVDRALTTAAFGAFLALGGVGLRMATLSVRAAAAAGPAATDGEWQAKP